MMMQHKAHTIVVGIDFSEVSDWALDEALMLSMARQAELHVLYVDDHFRAPEGGSEAADNMIARVEHHSICRIEDLGRRMGIPLLFRKLSSHFRLGPVAEQIVQLAAEVDADLVVVGTHGRRGLQRLVLGSVAERVVRLARCPVWVVRPKDHEGIGKVPEIEPPCADCLAKQSETGGVMLWCDRHSEHHVRVHGYHHPSGTNGSRSIWGTRVTPL